MEASTMPQLEELTPQQAEKMIDSMSRRKKRHTVINHIMQEYVYPTWAKQDKPTRYCVVTCAVSFTLVLLMITINVLYNLIA